MQQLSDLRIGQPRISGTLQDVSEHQTTLLELRQNSVDRLSFSGKVDSLKHVAGLALEAPLGVVKKISIMKGRDAAQKKSLNMDRPVTSGPLKALETPG